MRWYEKMKTIYILEGTELAFTSWEDCMKLMEKCNADPDKYGEVFIDEFHKYYIWEEKNEPEI